MRRPFDCSNTLVFLVTHSCICGRSYNSDVINRPFESLEIMMIIHIIQGKYAEALRCMERALVLRQHFFGEGSDEVGN